MRVSGRGFTTWQMMEMVVAVAILSTAVTFPPTAPAIFGFAGALIAHFVHLRSGHYRLGFVAVGFGIGAAIGILYFHAADPEAWEARAFVADMIVPSILTTLVLLGVHHRKQRSARRGVQQRG